MDTALERLGPHRRRRSSTQLPGIEIQMLETKNKDEAVGGERCI